MAKYGPYDLTNIQLPVGWDATKLQNESLQDGTTYLEILGMLSSATMGVKAQALSDPLFTSLSAPTSRNTVRYPIGETNAWEDHTEYGRPNAVRAENTGHMLPLNKYDIAIDITWDALRVAHREDIIATVRTVTDSWRDKYRVKFLSRLLMRGDISGEANGLGTSGLSPGFATAAASTGVDFRPLDFQGTAFTTDHEHYNAYNASGVWAVTHIDDAIDDLKEHGHVPTFELLISPTDADEIAALTGFTEPSYTYVQQYESTVRIAGPLTEVGSSPFHGAVQIGWYKNVRVWSVNGIPQNYGFMYKAYGNNSPQNPLRLYSPKPNFMMTVLQSPHYGNNSHPLNSLMAYSEFGIGVGADRTNGVAIYINSGTWADGTIS